MGLFSTCSENEYISFLFFLFFLLATSDACTRKIEYYKVQPRFLQTAFVRPAKTQIGPCTVWSMSSLYALWIARDPRLSFFFFFFFVMLSVMTGNTGPSPGALVYCRNCCVSAKCFHESH